MAVFRQPKELPEPPGMELEIIDIEHAMPLPDPSVAEQATVSEPVSMPPQPVPSTITPPVAKLPPNDPEPRPQPKPDPTPVQSVTAPPPVKVVETKSLGVGPVTPTPKPANQAPPALPQQKPQPVAAQSAVLPTPAAVQALPRPRINAGALSRSIAARAGQAKADRINSSTIGSAIGKAAPKGASGLTVRERTNLEEMIRSQITPCWNPPVAEEGVGSLSVMMRIQLDRSGAVSGSPSITAIKGETATNATYARALGSSVRRAVLRCSPLRLPPELFDAWSDVELNFDPRDVS